MSERIFNVSRSTKTGKTVNVGDFPTVEQAQAAMLSHYKATPKRGDFRYRIFEEELEEIGDEGFAPWKLLRPVCFGLIKGKRLPESFQITLQLSPEENEKFLRRVKPDFPVEQLAALYLNIRYENHAVSCVTGTSLKVFTLDKQIEHEWDDTVRRYFKKLQIPYVSAE
mgnify:CR=1 FL=1